MRGGWIAGGRSLVEAKRRNFDRADNGDASATPDASKFAFVRERTSNLAGRATAASFIGDAFVSPRCGGYFPFNWSTIRVLRPAGGALSTAQSKPLGFQGKQMQFVNRPTSNASDTAQG